MKSLLFIAPIWCCRISFAIFAMLSAAVLGNHLLAQSNTDADQKAEAPRFEKQVVALRQQIKQFEQKSEFENAVKINKQLVELLIAERGPDYAAVIDARWETKRLEAMGKMTVAQREELHDLVVHMAKYGTTYPIVLETAEKLRVFYDQHFGPDHPKTLSTYYQTGLAYFFMKKHDQAYQVLRDHLAEIEKSLLKNHPLTTRYKRLLAETALATEKFREAMKLYSECSADAVDLSSLVRFEARLAEVERRLGQPDAAEIRLKKIIEKINANGGQGSNLWLQCARQLSILYLHHARYQDAFPLLAAVAEKTDQNSPHWIRVQTMLAIYYLETGDLTTAEDVLNSTTQAKSDQLAANEEKLELLYEVQAELNIRKYDFYAAELFLKKTLAIRERIFGKSHYATLNCYSNLGLVLGFRGQHTQAQQYYRTAIEHMEKIGFRAEGLNGQKQQLAVSLIQTKNYQEADAILKALLAETNTENPPSNQLSRRERLEVSISLAESKLAQKDLDAAKQHFAIAKKLMDPATSNIDAIRIEDGRGEIAIIEQDFRLALDHFMKAERKRAVIEDAISGISSHHSQINQKKFGTTSLDGLMTALRLLGGSAEQLEAAYSLVLNRKSSVTQRQRLLKSAISQSAPADEINRLVNLGGKINRALSGLRFGNDNQEDIQDLIGQKEALERKLTKQSEVLRELLRSVSYADLRDSLEENEVFFDVVLFVDILENRSKIGIFSIQKNSPLQLVFVEDAQQLQALTDRWRQSQRDSLRSRESALQLYDLLVAPMLSTIGSGVDEIVVCPAGSVATIPLGALPGKSREAYLIEDYPITYQITGRAQIGANAVPNRLKKQPDLLVIADPKFELSTGSNDAEDGNFASFAPLPASRAEGGEVGRLFSADHRSQKHDVLTGASATKLEFQSRLQPTSPAFIHLATHTFFRNKEKLTAEKQKILEISPGQATGLVFAGANAPDRQQSFLTADEIADLPLVGTQQVVLSACNTSIGEIPAGVNEANFSLRSSFHIAGVDRVIASSWSVPDHATYQLMRHYYTNLWQKKMSAGKALQAAQIWMIHHYHPPTADAEQLAQRGDVVPRKVSAALPNSDLRVSPYYWGAWALSGDKR